MQEENQVTREDLGQFTERKTNKLSPSPSSDIVPIPTKKGHHLRDKLDKIRHALRSEARVPKPIIPLPEIENITFPPDSGLETLNIISTFPPEGKKFFVEMLAFARDEFWRYRPEETEDKEYLVTIVADIAGKYIDPNFPSNILDKEKIEPSAYDPDNKASLYRDAFYKIIKPLDGGKINLALRKLAPKSDLQRPAHHPKGFGGPPPSYIPKIFRIDKSKL